ncbi:TetR/AcrR family transcriptional regulator [Chitinophaga silvisoli]|uniref:TetR/AcrR family transcriptional regulator n=1 Tax=Chitinophaga silvisoli TaxID=2291814 RepID=A0A3E1NY35_9BACT|nr:TetR/AcrR family transcriptional regulator [Chitinophaga silvisoli]RFM32856.1 TetR/AcrR family transcriptional regulator [Chitinophaga silvisoli]
MGISDRKEREKQEMRKLIINAAMEMFVKDGYEKTSIRNIAEKIEYSPATIYLYYKDKDELFYEIQREAFDQLHAYFEANVLSSDPVERLRELLKAYIEYGIANPDLYDLMFILRSPMKAVQDNDYWENCHNAYQFLHDTVGAAKDQLRFADPANAGMILWSLGHGIISLTIRGRMKVTRLSEGEQADLVQEALQELMQIIQK